MVQRVVWAGSACGCRHAPDNLECAALPVNQRAEIAAHRAGRSHSRGGTGSPGGIDRLENRLQGRCIPCIPDLRARSVYRAVEHGQAAVVAVGVVVGDVVAGLGGGGTGRGHKQSGEKRTDGVHIDFA